MVTHPLDGGGSADSGPVESMRSLLQEPVEESRQSPQRDVQRGSEHGTETRHHKHTCTSWCNVLSIGPQLQCALGVYIAWIMEPLLLDVLIARRLCIIMVNVFLSLFHGGAKNHPLYEWHIIFLL